MKIFIFILFTFASNHFLSAKGNINHPNAPLYQFDLGITKIFTDQPNFYGIQGGLRGFIHKSPVFIGFEKRYYQTETKYNWPGIGDYSYLSNINCISPVLGGVFLQEYKINIGLNLQYNIVHSKEKLKTDFQLLKDYLKEIHEGSHNGFSIGLSLSYNLSKNFSIYSNASFLKISKEKIFGYIGIGIYYKLIFPDVYY